MPTISIIVPVYKVEQYLLRCIDSILAQTYPNFELILVDDGSPDNCGQICDEYASTDSRIHVIHQTNSGVSAARNAGLSNATGDYITFVDSDDYVDPDYLQNMYASKSDLTLCGLVVQNEHGDHLRTTTHPDSQYNNKESIPFSELYESLMLYSPYCKLFRSDIIKIHDLRFPQHISWGEDGMFVSDYLCYIESLTVIGQTGYHYIKYDKEDSLSTKVRPDIIDMIVTSREYCIRKMAETSPTNYLSVEIVCSEDIRRNCAYFIRKLLESTSMTSARKADILQHFMVDSYVADIILNKQKYFAYNLQIQNAFGKHNATAIVRTYESSQRLQHIKQWMYHHVYEQQPQTIKDIYQTIKRKARK